MATFYEVKQLLCRLFGHRDIEDNDDDITVELYNGTLVKTTKKISKRVLIQ